MKRHFILLIAVLLGFELNGRIHTSWTYEALNEKSTFIVIASPTKVKATSERAALPNIQTVHKDGKKEDVMAAGVETTFEVLTVLKGERITKTLVLHHYRLTASEPVFSGPQLVSFEPKEKKRYLMFLRKEADGRYVAVCGQTDPVYAVQELVGGYP